MSRLSSREYLKLHEELNFLWLHANPLFGRLSIREQRLLHDFFRPSDTLTEAELVAYRQQISNRQRSLPQQAGKALAHLDALVPVWLAERAHYFQVPRPRQAHGEDRRLVARAVVRPKIDHKKLLRALYLVAEDQLRREAGK